MTDETPDTKAPEGVFGNLPASRPGTRSPRRRTGDDEAAAEPREAAPRKRASKPAPPPPPPPPPEPASDPAAEKPPAPEPAPGQRIGSIEDLAWAGVAVAAEAATVGVKFASRALEAARKSVDRPD
jgi:hypothetical protein